MQCPRCKYQNDGRSKYCNNCGLPLYANPQPIQMPAPSYPQTAQSSRKAWYKRWWIWFLMGMGTLTLLAAARAGILSPVSKSEKSISDSAVKKGSETESTTERAQSEKKKSFGIGETFTDNGFDITLVSSDKFEDYSDFHTPDKGCYVLRVNFEMYNGSSTKKSYGSTYFECYADNKPVKQWYAYEENTNELTLIDELTPGREVTGSVYYEIPEDSESIEIEFSKYGAWTSDPVIFKIK